MPQEIIPSKEIGDKCWVYYNRRDKTIGVGFTTKEAIDNAKYSPEAFNIRNRPSPNLLFITNQPKGAG